MMMQIKYKELEYQEEVVRRTVALFEGQKRVLSFDTGGFALEHPIQPTLAAETFRNTSLTLSDEELLSNLHYVQSEGLIPRSGSLAKIHGVPAYDIEMETGTGKTFVYIQTMHELYQAYGWSKFIIVVPSIAIREGVKKSFTSLEGYFHDKYQRKINPIVYDSNKLHEVNSFAQAQDLSVMIINIQAFNSDFSTAGNKTNAKRRIHSERDDFGGETPIKVLAGLRPILILDEPQNMGGEKTQAALNTFNSLFYLNYSATHKTQNNLVYALDAYDAYAHRLVKRIFVSGFEARGAEQIQPTLLLKKIESRNKNLVATIELAVVPKGAKLQPKYEQKGCRLGDKLDEVSNNPQYSGKRITNIDREKGEVQLSDGTHLVQGEIWGVAQTLSELQQEQIRETIKQHLLRERTLYSKGIKVLSLFFIDQVRDYRIYADGEAKAGLVQTFFEEEYQRQVEQFIEGDLPKGYADYLKDMRVEQVHRGYFSIDKSGHMVDPNVSGSQSNEVSDYDLIMKDKERLLSYDEPTRFIFSHSALREGWDNPNVFQICILRDVGSVISRRQMVGRGLRLAVNKEGERQDEHTLGTDGVHEVNRLTVVANESFSTFAEGLQSEITATVRPRAMVNEEILKGLILRDPIKSVEYPLTDRDVRRVIIYLEDHDYINEAGHLSPTFADDFQMGQLPDYSDERSELVKWTPFLFKYIYHLYRPEEKSFITKSGNGEANPLNNNADKEEWLELWEAINHKYLYTVEYNSNELIGQCYEPLSQIKKPLQDYILRRGTQTGDEGQRFEVAEQKRIKEENNSGGSKARYDLVQEVAVRTWLKRETVVALLQATPAEVFAIYNSHPEYFIEQVAQIIREQKATLVISKITYSKTNNQYDNDIFTSNLIKDAEGVIKSNKHITDYLQVDSGVERRFAEDMDTANEVEVFAKLPKAFKIPTPFGNYSPDWAVPLKETAEGERTMLFIAETKGQLTTMQLRPMEQHKIECGMKLYGELHNNNNPPIVRYKGVTTYQELLDALHGNT